METTKKDTARAGALANNPTLPYLLGCCCLGLILAAIAGTIVLALIPTYLPSAADGLSKVNATSMEAKLHATAGSSSGRKRQSSSFMLSDYVGCSFGESGRKQVRNVLLKCVRETENVKDVSVTAVDIAYRDDSKKRSVLDREARQSSTLIYVISMIFHYHDTCPYGCQTTAGSKLQQCLYALPPGYFDLSFVPLWRGGALVAVATSLRFQAISWVSSILSKWSPFSPRSGPPTRPYSQSMTTASG